MQATPPQVHSALAPRGVCSQKDRRRIEFVRGTNRTDTQAFHIADVTCPTCAAWLLGHRVHVRRFRPE